MQIIRSALINFMMFMEFIVYPFITLWVVVAFGIEIAELGSPLQHTYMEWLMMVALLYVAGFIISFSGLDVDALRDGFSITILLFLLGTNFILALFIAMAYITLAIPIVALIGFNTPD